MDVISHPYPVVICSESCGMPRKSYEWLGFKPMATKFVSDAQVRQALYLYA